MWSFIGSSVVQRAVAVMSKIYPGCWSNSWKVLLGDSTKIFWFGPLVYELLLTRWLRRAKALVPFLIRITCLEVVTCAIVRQLRDIFDLIYRIDLSIRTMC